jgi:predicted nucleotidyltransferase
MNISKDISNKIEPHLAEALRDIASVTTKYDIPFFVLGATSRYLFFNTLVDIPTGRATLDIEFGIQVKQWEDFQRVTDGMIALGKYMRDDKKAHRLYSKSTVDILPFGEIELPVGTILWPPYNDTMMRTIGFSEAMRSSINVCVAKDPELIVKVSTPPGLILMKLSAWNDGDNDRKLKDAVDIHFLLNKYIDAGNMMKRGIIDEYTPMMALELLKQFYIGMNELTA